MIDRRATPYLPPLCLYAVVRPRKQESPQPLVKLEKSSPTPSFPGDSVLPTSPGADDVPEGSMYKRPRGNTIRPFDEMCYVI